MVAVVNMLKLLIFTKSERAAGGPAMLFIKGGMNTLILMVVVISEEKISIGTHYIVYINISQL